LDDSLGKPLSGWRLRLYTIIFEADTRAGRLFDQWLIADCRHPGQRVGYAGANT